MRMHHKKIYHLKKNIKKILYLILSALIIILMQSNHVLKPLFTLCKEKYLKKEYVIQNNNFKNKLAKGVFGEIEISEEKISEGKKSDSLFAVKETKDTKPIVYLYNTHQTEKYKKREKDKYDPSIVTATSYLNEKLNNKNIPTIMEYKSVGKVLDENNWKYGYSYKVSRMFINEAVKNNETIKYLFDIHRDSGSHSYTTLCVNEKCYAKLLFLVGLENPNYEENQKYAEILSKKVNEKVSGLSKGILQKQGKNVNGVYNQDFSNRTILIEVGGENNTIDEVYNSVDILSVVIEEFIREETENGI